MATLYLTRNETGTLLEMRNLNFWKALNEAVGETECDAYAVAADWNVSKEEAIIDSDECIGVNEHNENIPIAEYPSHPNPLITRPRFDQQ
jgi:hypothetical protein